jgi:hypothetical protein
MELTEGRVLLREFVDNDVGALLAIHADPRLLRYYAGHRGSRRRPRTRRSSPAARSALGLRAGGPPRNRPSRTCRRTPPKGREAGRSAACEPGTSGTAGSPNCPTGRQIGIGTASAYPIFEARLSDGECSLASVFRRSSLSAESVRRQLRFRTSFRSCHAPG